MANFANPTVGSNYTDFPGEIRASVDAALQQLSVGSHTNIPTGAIKFDTSANRWKKFNGSAFVDLTSTYDLNANVSVNQLNLGNDERARFGGSQELQIYNDGSKSRIESVSDHLFIKGNDITFFKGSTAEQFIDCNSDGSVDLFFDQGSHSTPKLSTTATGIQVTSAVGIGRAAALTLDVEGSAQIGAASTAGAELRIGRSGSGNRNAFIDFIGDNTYTDHGFRIIRKNGGANTETDLVQRGTGSVRFLNNEAAGFQFFTSATQKATITSIGRVGIGVTNPASIFEVQTATNERIRFLSNGSNEQPRIDLIRDSGTDFSIINAVGAYQLKKGSNIIYTYASDTHRFAIDGAEAARIDSSKRLLLGIQTTRTVGAAHAFQIESNTSGGSRMSIVRNSNDSGGPVLTFGKTRATSNGGNTIVANGDTLGLIDFIGNDGTDFANSGARITAKADGTQAANSLPSRLEFSTNGGATSPTLRGTFKENGVFLLGLTTTQNSALSLATAAQVQVAAPSGMWNTTGSFYNVQSFGQLYHHGSFEMSIVGGGYRKGSSQWQNYTINGQTGNATQLAFTTQSSPNMRFCLEANKADNSASAVAEKARFTTAGLLIGQSSGIGAKLDVKGASGTYPTVRILHSNVDTEGEFLRVGRTDINTIRYHSMMAKHGGSDNFIKFKVHNDGASSVTDQLSLFTFHGNNSFVIGLEDAARGPLHIHKTTNNDCNIHMTNTGTGTSSSQGFTIFTNTSTCGFVQRHNNVPMRFMMTDSGGNIGDRVRLHAGGNFSIGNTTNSFKLDVTGTVRISDNVSLTNAKRIIWGTSDSAFIEGDDGAYLRFGVNNETFRITSTALRIGQTTTDFAGANNTTVGASITKTGRIHSSTSDTNTGLTCNANVTSNSKHYISFRRDGAQIGSVTQNGASNVAYNVGSDRRLKENIIDLKDALTNLLKLKPRRFNFIADKTKQTVDGLIAQEVEEIGVCPNAIWKDKEDKEMMQIDYSKFMTLAIAAIQELAGKVSDLEAKLG